MLRALFEAVEAAGGERLAAVASLLTLVGFSLVCWRALAGVAGGLLEGSAQRHGLTLGCTLLCPVCDVRTAGGANCEK